MPDTMKHSGKWLSPKLATVVNLFKDTMRWGISLILPVTTTVDIKENLDISWLDFSVPPDWKEPEDDGVRTAPPHWLLTWKDLDFLPKPEVKVVEEVEDQVQPLRKAA